MYNSSNLWHSSTLQAEATVMAMMESLAIKKEDLYVEGFKSCSHSGRTHKDGTQNAVYSCHFTGFHGSQGFPHLLFPISLLAMICNSSAKIRYHLEKKEAAQLTAVFLQFSCSALVSEEPRDGDLGWWDPFPSHGDTDADFSIDLFLRIWTNENCSFWVS